MVDDIPKFGDTAPVTVQFDAVRCSECGKVNNPPTVVVGKYPDITIEDPRESRRRCHDCYGDLLEEATGLEPKVARTLALTLAGYSHQQVSHVLGRAVTKIEEYAKRARDEYHQSQDRSRNIEALFTYL